MGGRVEVLGVERRRRWTPEEKVAILDEAFGGRSSVAEVSERRGVSRALIYYWRRQAREGEIALQHGWSQRTVDGLLGHRAVMDIRTPADLVGGGACRESQQ